jgi:hypothetical protein
MTVTLPHTAKARECPVCPDEYDTVTIVEPDVEDQTEFFSCPECGYEWGWSKIETPQDTCAMGVPEDVRRRASAGMESAMSGGAPLIAGATLKIGPPA